MKTTVKLKQFGRLFHELCDGIEIINSTFTFQLILVVISSLVRNSHAFHSDVRNNLSPCNSGAQHFFLLRHCSRSFKVILRVPRPASTWSANSSSVLTETHDGLRRQQRHI